MPSTEFKLFAETMNGDQVYTVSIEESMQGLARLVVSGMREEGGPATFQGVDLTAAECEALGKHLISMGELLDKYAT